jgi:membrane glycosyltransferase
MPPVWLVLLIVSIVAADFPHRGRTGVVPDWAGWLLIGLVAGILMLPKLLIALLEIASGRIRGLANASALLLSGLAELVLSTLTAPIVLMFQVRAVLRVLSGFDGGWPPSNRADGRLGLGQAWNSSWWITCFGAGGLACVLLVGPDLAVWSLPVALPMILAPLLVWLTSLPLPETVGLWSLPAIESPVLDEWRSIYARWAGEHADIDGQFATPEAANVLG